VPELQLLCAEHASAVLEFETANRAYFAASISDRGDEFFAEFSDYYAARLAEQESCEGAYYVLIDEQRAVLGRFNLVFVGNGVAELGYRVAEQVAGHGVATSTVGDLCALAESQHAVTKLRAATSDSNQASRRVLLNNGFVLAEPADPADLGGKTGNWYERDFEMEPGEGSAWVGTPIPSG
jgi:ribosomal-protein-alanine N-acetyltransferase